MAVYEEFPVQFEKEAGVPIGVNIADVGWFMQPKAAVESIAPTSAAHSLLFVGDEVLSFAFADGTPKSKAWLRARCRCSPPCCAGTGVRGAARRPPAFSFLAPGDAGTIMCVVHALPLVISRCGKIILHIPSAGPVPPAEIADQHIIPARP